MIIFPKVGDTLYITETIPVPTTNLNYYTRYIPQKITVSVTSTLVNAAIPPRTDVRSITLLPGEWYQIAYFIRPAAWIRQQINSELLVGCKLDLRPKERRWVKPKLISGPSEIVTIQKSIFFLRIEDLSERSRILLPHELNEKGHPNNDSLGTPANTKNPSRFTRLACL